MRKNILFFIMFLFSMTVFAQQKKVAVLDPICKDNSVNTFFQQIVRGIMESTVDETNEYVAYDRTALDKIMQEQNFQHSGAVSDNQIKRLGELAGVDYVLVTEVSAYESYINVIAKILNVETGQSTRAQSEVMEMTPSIVQNSCRQLARQIFGIIEESTGLQQGELQLEEGKYFGEIKNGQPHGEGKLQYKDSDEKSRVYYEGGWNNGLRHGYGIIEWKNGARYEGGWANGLRNGYGTMDSKNGDRYEGEFERDKPNGYGIRYYKSGGIYTGGWKDGLRSGQAKYQFRNGDRYEGEFERDRMNGYGTYYYADKTGKYNKYVGNFKDNAFHGYGTFYNDIEGIKDSGYSVNGKKDGEWIRIKSDGTKQSATYSNGKIVRDWH